MPDGSVKEGLGEESLQRVHVGTVVSFERVGFARLHKREKDGSLEFWYGHM